MDGALVDDHMIRIIPRQAANRGLIFSYLSCPLGQQLLESLAYGAVQKEIKAFQLENILVPQVRPAALEKISSNIERARQLRDDASVLCSEAVLESLDANQLPLLNDGKLRSTFRGRHLRAFEFPITELHATWHLLDELRLEANFYNFVARTAIANIRTSPSKCRKLSELVTDITMGGRFKRNYVTAEFGTPFLSGKNIVQVRHNNLKYLSNAYTDDLSDMLVKKGWILVTCSGTIGRTCFVWHNFEDYAASQHILRVIPNTTEVDAGYLYAFLSSRYGYEQIIRFRYGSVIDEITDRQLGNIVVPLPERNKQRDIGDKVRLAYEKRAEALTCEDEAQIILMREIKGSTAKERLEYV
jgi:type I restriction enzyme S subunit